MDSFLSDQFYQELISLSRTRNLLPRKEYKTITVKSEAFQKFVKTIREAKRDDPSLDNSEFLNSLIAKYLKTRRSS